ncbi:MAG: glycosyltransferase family 4 protein [Bacteroidales bacterium]|nr:glycosyltransferase family 4 protein [Bacteroidales bacterium]
MKAIIDTGYEVYISKPDEDERVKYFEGMGCRIIKTDFSCRGMNPLADLKLMLTYRKLIKQLKPKVVLTYTIKPNVYGGMACRLNKTPQIVNVTGLGDAIENGGWLQKLTVTLYKVGISKAKCVFFQNRSNRDTCIKLGIANETSRKLPGSGVNLAHHTYQVYPADGIIRFLFIARLLKDKGTDEFFEMAKTIKDKYLHTEFQILGWIEGDYQQQLDDLVAKGIVVHLGTTSDVRPYLKDVHCTIMPSYHEGMSNVNLESAANGRPVITTNVPGCKETVDDNISGFLVEARNTQSLINGVERFLALSYEQKKQMGIEGRKKVEREYDRQIVVKEYLKAIANV